MRDYNEQEIACAYYGKIDFLGNHGIVGETIYYKDKQSFDKEISESSYIGRPIDYEIFYATLVSIKEGSRHDTRN